MEESKNPYPPLFWPEPLSDEEIVNHFESSPINVLICTVLQFHTMHKEAVEVVLTNVCTVFYHRIFQQETDTNIIYDHSLF